MFPTPPSNGDAGPFGNDRAATETSDVCIADNAEASADLCLPSPRRPRVVLQPAEEVSLEDRVIDLELKLATLSRVLQQRRGEMPRPVSPPGGVLLMNDDVAGENTASIPYLESPCPSRRDSSGILHELMDSAEEKAPKASRKTLGTTAALDMSLKSTPENNEMSNLATTRMSSSHAPDATPVQFPSSLREPSNGRSISPSTIPPPPPLPYDDSDKQQAKQFSTIQQKWLNYLDTFQESTPDVDVQMQEFIRVPSQVEWLLGFGWMVCVDCFLYVLTILVIRFVWSCVLLFVWGWRRIRDGGVSKPRDGDHYRFHRRHVYQLIQVGIIYIVYRTLLVPISIGKLYHWIRGQAMLKLYVLIAIVEVFDRLFCSLGQDCLDSMYWNTTRRPKSARLYISIVVVLCYAACHTLILFVHVATLNVAMNSADQALLALLISGNFAEIKSTVFKKYNKKNLFKIAASDICERFKLALFLSLVLVLNLSQGMDRLQLVEYVKMCCIVWFCEVVADWIKHSFITKFNFIPSSVYPEYALLLAGDVTGIGHEEVNLDNSHAVVKRIGLAQIPLVCVLLRYLSEAARYGLPHFQQTPLWMVLAGMVGIWCLLLALKITLGAYLQTLSRAKLYAAPELALVTPAKKKRD